MLEDDPMSIVTITIEREGSDFPVHVSTDNPAVGYYTHPATGADTPYDLTADEMDEAREMFEAGWDDDEREPDYWQPSRREEDAGANLYFASRRAQLDRRADA
jgi:hypothetical protein